METQRLAIPFALPSLCGPLGMGFCIEPAVPQGGKVQVRITWVLLDWSSPCLSSCTAPSPPFSTGHYRLPRMLLQKAEAFPFPLLRQRLLWGNFFPYKTGLRLLQSLDRSQIVDESNSLLSDYYCGCLLNCRVGARPS